MLNIDLSGKNGLILGVTNQRSIAWGIADAVSSAGARLALSYQSDRLLPALQKLTAHLDNPLLFECDISSDEQLDALFAHVKDGFGKLDFVVHSVAYAPPETFSSPFRQTSRADWQTAMDVSAYSLVAVADRAAKLMPDGGSITTLTYLAAERVVPHYNMMGVAKAALEASSRYLAYDLGPAGIRVNAISAGPIKTLAASGIGDFRYILKWNQYNSPLKRNVTLEDVGGSALYLLSDLSTGVTGEIHHVDCGYHVVGMKAVDAPDISVV